MVRPLFPILSRTLANGRLNHCYFDIGIQMQETMKKRQRSKSNLSITLLHTAPTSNKRFANMNKNCRHSVQISNKYYANICSSQKQNILKILYKYCYSNAEDNEVGTEERVKSVNSCSPYCFASIWFHHKKYRVLSLSLACAPQRDSTFVNLRDTEGARARRSVLNLSIPRLVPFAKIMQIKHLISSKLCKYCTNPS